LLDSYEREGHAVVVCDRGWRTLCGISDTGSILVRPDGRVAMRAVDDTEADTLLNNALAAAHGHST
jgi:hypothetical protein